MNLLQSTIDTELTVRIGDDDRLVIDFRAYPMPLILEPTDTLLIHREGRQIIFEVRRGPIT